VHDELVVVQRRPEVLVTTVLGREVRAGEEWLYLDVGAYNGLMETQQTVGQWRFPLWTSRPDHEFAAQIPYTVTGPTCDSSDTMFYGAPLPETLGEGDRLYVASAGAYTLSYASSFNGFPRPRPASSRSSLVSTPGVGAGTR
jgi:ornithine decarboxylase